MARVDLAPAQIPRMYRDHSPSVRTTTLRTRRWNLGAEATLTISP